MATELGLTIKIGALVGAAIGSLGTVQGHIKRLGETTAKLIPQQKALNSELNEFVGPRKPAQIAQLTAQYERLGSTIEKVKSRQAALTALSERQGTLRTQRQGMRSDALDTVALGATLGAPVKAAIDFESAMADVRKVVDFERPDGLQKMGDDLLALSRALPLTAVELASITASGGQLGIANKDLLGFTKTVAKMATAFDMSPEDAGDSMAKLANVYQIPILQISKLGDAINELSNKSPAKASDIVRTLGRVGGVAKQFGLTELQTASLSNAFIALGKPPEVAGTAINAMLTKLATADKQSAKFQGALASIGMSSAGLKKSIANDAQGALLGFLQTLEQVPAQQRMGIMVDLFGLEYADDVSVLAGSVKTYSDSIAVLNTTYSGSMDKEFAARAATTANNLRLLKNNATELGVNLGATVLPALNELLNTIKPTVVSVAGWAKENPKLVSGLIQLGAFLLTAKVTVLALGYAINLLLAGGSGVMLLFGKGAAAFAWLKAGWLLNGPSVLARVGTAAGFVGRALLFIGRALFANPIGLAILAIAGGAYLIYRNWTPISKWFGGVWVSIKSGFSSAWTWISSLPANFARLGGDLISGLVGGITAKLGAARDAIVGMGTSIKGWFADTLGIKSPSRVFMDFGGNIGMGAQLGILGGLPGVAGAAKKLANVAMVGAVAASGGAFAGVPQSNAAMQSAAAGPAQSGQPVVINFSPTINVGGGGGTQAQVAQAMQLSIKDLESMIRRVQAEQSRRAY